MKDRDAGQTSTVRICLSSGSREDVEPTASSSFSRSLTHKEKASDSLLKRSHHVRIISSWTVLEDNKERSLSISCITRANNNNYNNYKCIKY